MNFKRVLVLVMALVMMVSVCAPTVSAIFRPETKHEHHDILNGAELEEKYEEAKATVEAIVKDIEENHEEYYALGYAYAKEAGYIGAAIEAIEAALNTLPEIDLEGAPISDELKADLNAELEALEPTFEKILGILESGEAEEFDGFVKAMLTLEGDLYTHLNNIYAILEQVGVEYVIPALEVFEREVLPKIEEAVNAYVEAVVEHVTEKLAPYYDKAVEIIGIAHDTYDLLVEVIVKINLYVEGAVDTVVGAYNKLVETLTNIYGSVEQAIIRACEIYNKIIDTVNEINTRVENAISNVKAFVVHATEVYRYTVNLLVEVYGRVEGAIIVAEQLYDYIVKLLIDGQAIIEGGIEIAGQIFDDVLDILEEAYETQQNIHFVATRISAYIADMIAKIYAAINDTLDGAVNGNYELKDDSYYVSIGNAEYADALAGKLNLAHKHDSIIFENDYIEQLINADLVTAKFDNGSFVELLEAQVEGKVAEIISSNGDLMAWYNGLDSLISNFSSNKWIPQEYKDQIVGGLTNVKSSIDSNINLNAQVVDLDWDKYLDAEGKAALDRFLAEVRLEVLAQGIEEYHYIDINPMIYDMLDQNGLSGIFTLSFEPIVVPQADLVVFAVENMIYGYAEFIGNIAFVLENAPADATIVLTPVSNAFVGYSFKGFELGEYAETLEPVVDALNAHLYALALVNENVIFVNSEDADDIYDALNVYCNHIYDDCLDTVCDRCLEERVAPGHSFTNYIHDGNATCTDTGTETAKCDGCDETDTRVAETGELGHSFTNYVSDDNATCTKNGTETAKCDRCGEKDTRTVENSMLDHDFAPATCTKLSTCKNCGLEQGELLEHVLGDWRVTKDPTSNAEGLKERKCLNCDYAITETIPYDTLSTIAIVSIIVGCVAIAGGLSAAVAGILRKKNKI